ncbi:MAG: hypothetical protein HYY13_11490 [Nitrospirae bacterium]|nr:hypothetical protein [Nitrospirota bacterium]
MPPAKRNPRTARGKKDEHPVPKFWPVIAFFGTAFVVLGLFASGFSRA